MAQQVVDNLEDFHAQGQRSRWIWWRLSGTREELEAIREQLEGDIDPPYDFCYAQLEESASHGLHLQGIAHFHKQMYKSNISRVFQNWGTLSTKQDVDRMWNYVRKDATRVEGAYVSIGVFPVQQHNNQGGKRDMMWEEMKNDAMDMSDLEFRRLCLDRNITHENVTWLLKQRLEVQRQHQREKLLVQAEQVQWREWQLSLIEKISGDPHPRHIHVILDKRGDNGKTFFMKHYKILHEERTVNLSNGKTADLMHVASKKPNVDTVFVNLPRSVHGIVNYQAFEQVKDGEFTTTKYDGQEVTTSPTHMVIFTNEPLNWDGMSKDRWQIMVIRNNGFTWYNHTEYKMMGGEDGVAGRDMGAKRMREEEVEEADEADTFCPIECYMNHQHIYPPDMWELCGLKRPKCE